MKLPPFPLLNRALGCALWITLIGCGPPAWRGGIHALLAWSPAGVRVVEVPPDSPADRAGLHVDDRILKIDGRATEGLTSEQVQQRLTGEVGSTVDLVVLRGDKQLQLNIPRAPYDKPREPAAPRGY